MRRLRRSELAEKSLFTLGGMSQLVGRLERAGLVHRAVADEDRRGTYAQITEEGLAKLRAAKATEWNLARRHFLSLYDGRELATMASYWQRFLEQDRPGALAPEEVVSEPRTEPWDRETGAADAPR